MKKKIILQFEYVVCGSSAFHKSRTLLHVTQFYTLVSQVSFLHSPGRGWRGPGHFIVDHFHLYLYFVKFYFLLSLPFPPTRPGLHSRSLGFRWRWKPCKINGWSRYIQPTIKSTPWAQCHALYVQWQSNAGAWWESVNIEWIQSSLPTADSHSPGPDPLLTLVHRG